MDVLGDYTIQKQLAHGAFGDVYLAEHRFIKKIFAIKILPEEVGNDPTFLRRFETQVAEIAAIDHPNIVKIHNVSCFDGRYFLVMDPIFDSLNETMHLDHYLQSKESAFSEDEFLHILRQVALGLDFAHEKGIVHGSLKPMNILIQPGSKIRVCLSDFGILRLIGDGLSFVRLCSELSSSMFPHLNELSENALQWRRQFVRSFAFLSPEQKMKEGNGVDEKIDSYAFGVLTYYLLTRKVPEGCFESVTRLLPQLNLNWDLFIHRCLQVNPQMRPQKLASFMEEALQTPKQMSKEMLHFSEIEAKVDHIQQMAFEFGAKVEETVAASTQVESTVNLMPALKPQELARPEYDPDPSSIFQRDLTVSHYTPNKVEIKEIEPILTQMVVVPGGQYMRGSNEGSRDEMPRHMIRLSSFALDIHPVTNEQFVRFLTVMGGEKDQNNNDIIRLRDSRIKRSSGKLVIESGYAKHPVVGVTWYGAVAYAKWVGKRLPFESEWEVAAHGGKEGSMYPTGNDIDRATANFFSSDTTAVMSYAPNGFGLYDMAGNVYDWCQDWYAYNYYDTSSVEPDHPKGPQQGVYRVLRGGCWKSLKEDLRCSHRHRNNPGAVNGTYGFRCAANVTSDPFAAKPDSL